MHIRSSALSATALLLAAGLGAAALAQTPPAPAASTAAGLAAEIERDGSCNADNPVGEVRRHLLLASGMSAAEIGRALAMVTASPTACAPLKAAAMTLAEAYPQPNGAPQTAAADPVQPPPAAEPVQVQEPAPADLKFVVGAPPRRLTKGRNPGS